MPLGAFKLNSLGRYFAPAATGRTAKTVTAVGNAKVSTTQSKFGGTSLILDGTSDYLTVSSGGFNVGSGDITIEFWVRHSAVNDQQVYCDLRTGANNHYIFYVQSDNKLVVYDGLTAYTSTATMAANTWYHLALSRSGTTLKVFRDGTEVISGTNSRNLSDNSTIVIGSSYEGFSTNSVNGYMDEVRISSTARYTANFTAPTAPFVNDSNTLLLIHCDGTNNSTSFIDDNGSRFRQGLIAQGVAAVSTTQSKFGGASAAVGTSGNANLNGIYIPTNADYFGTSSPTYSLANWGSAGMPNGFTVELWVRYRNLTNSYDSGHATICLGERGDWPSQWSLGTDSFGALGFEYFNGSTYPLIKSSNNSIVVDTWYHIAAVRNGSTITVYKDGTSVASASVSGTPSVVARDLSIGSHYRVGVYAYIDEVRISKTARYTANFTAPTAAFTNDSDTLLLMHANGTNGSTDFIDDNA